MESALPSMEIQGLRKRNLVSYKDILVEAIATGRRVIVNANLDDPVEILKGTYLAKALSDQGYGCKGKIVGDNRLYFECVPTD